MSGLDRNIFMINSPVAPFFFSVIEVGCAAAIATSGALVAFGAGCAATVALAAPFAGDLRCCFLDRFDGAFDAPIPFGYHSLRPQCERSSFTMPLLGRPRARSNPECTM